jgi:hypothetical protein
VLFDVSLYYTNLSTSFKVVAGDLSVVESSRLYVHIISMNKPLKNLLPSFFSIFVAV